MEEHSCCQVGAVAMEADPGLKLQAELSTWDKRIRRSALPTFLVVLLSMGEMLPVAALAHFFQSLLGKWIQLIPCTYILFFSGKVVLELGWLSVKKRDLNMFTLISLGVVASYAFSLFSLLFYKWFETEHGVSVYFEAASVIVFLTLVGQWLETRAKAKTGGALTELLSLAPQEVSVIVGPMNATNAKEMRMPISSVQPGHRLRVRPGERIPADGKIVFGESSVDESWITGEAVPVAKRVKDLVLAGTLLCEGTITVEVAKVGGQTLLGQVTRQVVEAQQSKAPVQRIADQVSKHFVGAVVVVAVVTCFCWAFFSTKENALALGVFHAVTVLVIACPCALGLATPVAIVAGMGKAAQMGVLFKNAEVLERAAGVDVVVVDKTGTLTLGEAHLAWWEALSSEWNEISSAVVATLAGLSLHPLSQAIARGLKKEPVALSDFQSIPGSGVEARAEGKVWRLGKLEWLLSLQVKSYPEALEKKIKEQRKLGRSTVFASCDSELVAVFALSDTLRAQTIEAISFLKAQGKKIVVASGDHLESTSAVARTVGIESVYAQMSPVQKAELIGKIKKENRSVAMVGDGINDAVALAVADVGIAMGSGSDIAQNSASITLVNESMRTLIAVFQMSGATMKIIRQNLGFAFGYNAVAILVATGIFYPFTISPMIASIGMTLSSLGVILNALRLQRYGKVDPARPFG